MLPESVINPELVAAKLARADNLEDPRLAKQIESNPRLVELLWFIQWRSFQPGGLDAMVNDLLAGYPDRFVTEAMKAAGPPRKNRYDLAQCLAVWRETWQNNGCRRRATKDDLTLDDLCDGVAPDSYTPARLDDFGGWLDFYFDPNLTLDRIARGQGCDKETILQGVERFNWPFLKADAMHEAERDLAPLLRDLCIEKTEIRPPKYCPELLTVIFDFMDRHANEAGLRLADTEVSRKVFDGLDYAWAARKFVRIDGNSRFGKTESVRTWCLRYPGRARLVTVPPSNSDSDLMRAIAEALGMIVRPSASKQAIRDKVEFVIRHGRLGWIFDESHFLFPTRYGPHTAPSRLNWLRTQIVDRGLSCALVATPQAYEGQLKRFDKLTCYNMEQFTGRIARRIQLPEELTREDLFAVARFHFADFRSSELKVIVMAARISHSYLKAIEDIASLARWKAQTRKSATVEFHDVEAAITETIPGGAALLSGHAPEITPAAEREKPAPAIPARPRRKTAADILRDHRPGGAPQPISSPDPAPSEPGAGMTRAELVPD